MKVPVAVLAAVLVPALVAFPILAQDIDPASVRLDHFTGFGGHQVDGIGPHKALLYRSYVISRLISVSLDGLLPLDDDNVLRRNKAASLRADRLSLTMRFDLDGDRRVTPLEVEEYLAASKASGRMSAGSARAFADRMKANFAKEDGDGVVTLDEAYGAALEARPGPVPIDRENPEVRHLLRMDLNGDGQVRPMEGVRVIRVRYGD